MLVKSLKMEAGVEIRPEEDCITKRNLGSVGNGQSYSDEDAKYL